MSHYAVGILHRDDDDLSELLAPYDENIEVEQYITMNRQEAIDYARMRAQDSDKMSDEDCWRWTADLYSEDSVDDDGNIWSTYNPKSKWDWWVPGGRFCDLLEGRADKWIDYGYAARVKDLDFSADPDAYENALEEWSFIMSGKNTFYNPDYFKEYYDGPEDYARRMSAFSLFAIVTPDGVWYEKGEMGWFAQSSESPEESRDWDNNFYQRFIATADPNLILTIVDCHI